VNQTPTRFLLRITENPGEFRIDPQNAIIYVKQNDVKQNDGFWHARKQPVEEGRLSIEHVQRNDRTITSLSHGGNCSAICEENNSFQKLSTQLPTMPNAGEKKCPSSSKRNSQQACPTASFPIWRRPAWSYGVVAKWAALVAVELPPM
jgi:hypothetical protein